MGKDHNTLGRPIPSGRLTRVLRMGGLAAGISGGVAAGGLRSLATGRKPDLEQLVFSPGNMARLAESLSHMRGAALKLGQMLSMDTGVVLPPELNRILAGMRDSAVPMPPKQLKQVLDREWGSSWQSNFKRFDVRPFASASIGQVHRATTREGQDLAIKVQYPGVRDSIDSDIDNLAVLLKISGLLPKDAPIDDLLEAAKRQLHAEADYESEAQNLFTFADLLRDDPLFRLPDLNTGLSNAHVLAMSYVHSEPLEALADAPQETRDQAAEALITLVLRELFEFRVMQTDPNLANYRYSPKDGRIVLLDFGAVQTLAPTLQNNFKNLARAALARDVDWTRAAMQKIGYFNDATPQRFQTVFLEMFDMAMSPIRQETPFDFGKSDLMHRLRDRGLEVGGERELQQVPPAETLFLHRKIAGTYLIASMLKARVKLRPLVEAYCAE
ncbi:ABC1 kinase family protein [Donghicola sp. XS_ASV15]|uniref:ABC1 kinase family protein n=1 Tax=Donghicola sp. XS_ASV15 TaxID=3241295 RepID=UPI003512615E